MKHLLGLCILVLLLAVHTTSAMPIAVKDDARIKMPLEYVTDLSGTWTGTFEANGRWDYTMTLKKESAEKFTGTIVWVYDGKKLDPPDAVTIEVVSLGKLQMTLRKDTTDGTFTANKMIVDGVNGPMTFTRTTPPPKSDEGGRELTRLSAIDTGAVLFTLKNLPSGPKFESKAEGFRIRLPQVTIKNTPSKMAAAPGEFPTPGRIGWEVVEAYVEISITRGPSGLIASWSKEESMRHLGEMIEAGISNSKGQKIYEKEIKVGDLTGKEAKMTAGGLTVVMRVFLANDRGYTLVAALHNVEDAEALVKTAFDSFEVIKP